MRLAAGHNIEACVSEGCLFPGSHSRNLCRVHYLKWRKSRMPECSTKDCERKSNSRGMCNHCYQRWYRNNQKSVKVGKKAETAVRRFYMILKKLDRRAFFLGALAGLFVGILI